MVCETPEAGRRPLYAVGRLTSHPAKQPERPAAPAASWPSVAQLYACGSLSLPYSKAPGLPFSFALKAPSFAFKAPDVPFSFALKELDLLFIPGSQALESASPVLLTQPSQRPQYDGADDHPLIEAAASQHMTHHGQPDQPQRRPTGKARVPRLRRRAAAARRDVG